MKPRIDRAYDKVCFYSLSGFINHQQVKSTVYNAAIRHGGFKSVRVVDHYSNTNILDMDQSELLVAVRSRIVKNGDRLNCIPIYNCEDKREYCFQGISESWEVFTQNARHLCYAISMKDGTGKDRVVADVIWPNIIMLRFLDIKFGSETSPSSDLKARTSLILMSRIIKEGCALLKLSKREFVNKVILNKKEKITEIMRSNIGAAAEQVAIKVQSCEDEILKKRKEIRDLEITLESNKKALSAYDSIMENLSGKFSRELDVIRGMNQVVAIDEYSNIDNGIISVDVADIKVKCQKNWYYLGNYTIHINIADSTVRFTNQSGLLRRSYWGSQCHHPHCNESGRPCLGNISTQVVELIGSLDLAFLVNLCISYLQSVNISDAAGKYIVNWPICKEDGTIISDCNDSGLITCCVCHQYMPEVDNDDWEQCDDCGGWMHSSCADVIETKDGERHVCRNCSSNYRLCLSCGKYELKDLFEKCEVCGDIVCPDCMSSSSARFAYYRNIQGDFKRVEKICKKHHIHKCEGCGIHIIDTDTCPSCDLGLFSVGKCALCGEITPETMFRSDFTDICTYCSVEGLTKCSACGRYERLDNMRYDVISGAYSCIQCEPQGEDFDPTTPAEPDYGAIELQNGHLEAAIGEYLQENNLAWSREQMERAMDELRARIYDVAGAPPQLLETGGATDATIHNMIARILVDYPREVAEGENTPLPEGIREFYNQPVVNEEPIVDDTITG